MPTMAILLDYNGGWTRPCDSVPRKYIAASWGVIPWDAADYLADAVLDMLWPGYRMGSLMHDERGTMAPTPFGDAADVLLSDALLEVLMAYDTVVVAHRLETDAAAVAEKLNGVVSKGGKVVITASSLRDLQEGVNARDGSGGALASVLVGTCIVQPAGTRVELASGDPPIVEAQPFALCGLSQAAGSAKYSSSSPSDTTASTNKSSDWELLASVKGQPAVVRVKMGNGSVTVIAAGFYGMALVQNHGKTYGCGVDEMDTRATQPLLMVEFVRYFFESMLRQAALFDLGNQLAWVPQRVGPARYVLTVINPSLREESLNITSLLAPVAWVQELVLDQTEKGAVGYLPHGYESAKIGNSTNTTIAGADTRIFLIALTDDNDISVLPPSASPPPSYTWARSRLLRLQPRSTGNIREALLSRPAFDANFGGVVVDWEYVWSRSTMALSREAEWLSFHNVRVVVDFTSGLTLFPGMRLCNDIDMYYEESMAQIRDVLSKLPLLSCTNAIITLHGISELPPANFSHGDVVANYRASVASTLEELVGEAAALGVTLHLRRSSRNDILAGGSLLEQADFAASIKGKVAISGVGHSGSGKDTGELKIAPSLAYGSIHGDSVDDMKKLISSGAASLTFLSSSWASVGGRYMESAPLSLLHSSQLGLLKVCRKSL